MNQQNQPCRCKCCEPPDNGRRSVLTGALALALSSTLTSGDASAERSPKPAPGDRLAFMLGDRKDQEIKPADIEIGKEPTLAYPLDPASGKPLISRVGLLVVVRLKPEELQPSSQRNAADGIVAFSAICTHYGCPVTTLHPSQSQIVCNCHGSVFNAADRGAVTAGPATRRLSMLPLAIKEGALVVAGALDGPIGPPT